MEVPMPIFRGTCLRKKIALLCFCLAGSSLLGCGDDSSGTAAPGASADQCSVSKTANNVVVKVSADGSVSTTVYVFDGSGNMTSLVTTFDYSGMGDDATAKSVCNASAAGEGFSASYENGLCTITQTVGLVGGTLDRIYEEQSAICDEMNVEDIPASDESKPLSSDGKSSSNEGKTSSSELTHFDDGKSSSSSGIFSQGSSSSETQPPSVANTLEELRGYKCKEEFLGMRVPVLAENSDYACIVYETSYYVWLPVIDNIKNAPTCNEKFKTGTGNKTMFVAESDYGVYGCILDIKDPYDFDSAEYIWKKYGTCKIDGKGAQNESKSSSSSVNAKSSSSIPPNTSSSIPKSSNSNPGESVVTFVDGLMWEPSYGKRVRTFFNTDDESSFFDEESGDESGWWFKYTDDIDGGYSIASATFTDTYLNLDITLKYSNWYLETSGGDYYYAPDPYPYVGFGFSFSPGGEDATVDISGWEGICVTYESTGKFEIAVKSPYDDGLSWYKLASKATTATTLNVAFSSLTRSKYAEYPLSRAEALKEASGIHFKYTNDESGTGTVCKYGRDTAMECDEMDYIAWNTIKIYKIGKYGTCNNSTATTL